MTKTKEAELLEKLDRLSVKHQNANNEFSRILRRICGTRLVERFDELTTAVRGRGREFKRDKDVLVLGTLGYIRRCKDDSYPRPAVPGGGTTAEIRSKR